MPSAKPKAKRRNGEGVRRLLVKWSVLVYLTIEVELSIRAWVESTEYDPARIMSFAGGMLIYYFGKRILDSGLTIQPAKPGKNKED